MEAEHRTVPLRALWTSASDVLRVTVMILGLVYVGSCSSTGAEAASHEPKPAVAEVEICGVRVPIDIEGVQCRTASKRDYEALGELTNLKSFVLFYGEFSTMMEALAPHSKLEDILVGTEDFDDRSIERLRVFPQLRSLSVSGAPITDDGIPALVATLPALEELVLCDTGATDAGVERLSELSQLRVLKLCGRKFTPEVLESIVGFRKLERIDLIQVSIQEEVALDFARRHAELEVRWGDLVLPARRLVP